MNPLSENVPCREHNSPQNLYCFHCWRKLCTECYSLHQRGHDIRYITEAQRLLKGLNLQSNNDDEAAAGPSNEPQIPRCLSLDEPCPVQYHRVSPWAVYCVTCGLKACLYCYRSVFPEDYMSRAFGAVGFYCQAALGGDNDDDLDDTTSDSEGYGTYDEEDDN